MTTVDRRAVQEMLEKLIVMPMYDVPTIQAIGLCLADIPSAPFSNAQAVAWQPIETAPRRGEWIVVCDGEQAFTCAYQAGRRWPWTQFGGRRRFSESRFILWAPLPTGDAKEA